MTEVTIYGFNYSPIKADAAALQLLKSITAPEWVQEQLQGVLECAVEGHSTVARPSAAAAAFINYALNAKDASRNYSDCSQERFESMIKHYTVVTPVGVYACSAAAAVSAIKKYTNDWQQAADLLAECMEMTRLQPCSALLTVDSDWACIEEIRPYQMPLNQVESVLDVLSTVFSRRTQYRDQGFTIVFPEQTTPMHSKAGFYYINDICGLKYQEVTSDSEYATLVMANETIVENAQKTRKS